MSYFTMDPNKKDCAGAPGSKGAAACFQPIQKLPGLDPDRPGHPPNALSSQPSYASNVDYANAYVHSLGFSQDTGSLRHKMSSAPTALLMEPKPANLFVPLVLFALLAPGMLFVLPGAMGPNGISGLGYFMHAGLFAFVYHLFRVQFKDFY